MDWHFGKRYFLSIRSHPFPERNGKIINRFRYPKCALSGFAGEIIFPLSLWKVIRHFTGLVHDRSHQIAVTKPKSYLGLQFHDVAPKRSIHVLFYALSFLTFSSALPQHFSSFPPSLSPADSYFLSESQAALSILPVKKIN